jgi:tetratricopeptide (TPR) repeat protein
MRLARVARAREFVTHMTTPSSQELSRALAAVRERPEDFSAWDELESLAADDQAPEPVAELYPELLSRDLSQVSLKRLGERALRFCEGWFADDAPPMQAVLLKVFELDPSDESVFDRLTVGLSTLGDWKRLLDLYARAVDATDSLDRQTRLLDDAVRVARELAQDDDRAIVFMKRLLVLRPTDAGLRAQLERLLERNQRYRELITLWDAAAQALPEREAAHVKVQIAELWLDKLDNPAAALDVLRKVLESDPREALALALAERVLGMEEAAVGTRREAMRLLTETFQRIERPLDAARVTRAGASFSFGDERERLLRASAAIFLTQELGDEALNDLGELLALRPEDDALAKEIGALVARLGAHERHVQILLHAAGQAKSKRRGAQLSLRAATIAHDPLGDRGLAVRLCERVFTDDSERDLALDAGRALDALLEAQNSHEARIPVLERLSLLEPDAERKRELLGALAKLSATRGDGQRAIATWQKRLQEDPRDREALDGLIALLDAQRDFVGLVDALRRRAGLFPERGGNVKDLSRIAQVYAEQLADIESALRSWGELYAVEPEAFSTLEIGPLLDRAGSREAERAARVLSGLGDAYLRFVSDHARAFNFFSRALLADPVLPSARAGLSQLLQDEALRGRAAEALASAYATTGDVAELVALLPHRLAGAADAKQRAVLLRQTAHLEEARLERAADAFEHLCAALLEEPHDSSSDAELMRLAGELELWGELRDAFARAAQRLDASSARAGQLRLHEAELSETRLKDLARAFEAYTAAARSLALDGKLAEAVCRTAARLGNFAAAFEVLAAFAHKHDRVPEALLGLLESETSGEEAYRALCKAAEASLDSVRLTPPVRRELLTRISEWQERHCGDPEAAERLLTVAAGAGGAPHSETLRKLVVLQRRRPGRALFDTLIAVSDLSEQDLDLLVESAELARDVLADEALFKSALERLFVRSAGLLASGRRAAGRRAAESCLTFAAGELARLLERAGDAKGAVQTLRDASGLPLDAATRGEFLGRAAKLALEQLADRTLGILLYERALELAPEDAGRLSALASEYDKAGRLDELLTVLRRELALTRAVPRRLELRLDIARVMGEIEARGARMDALRDNLREAPGHAASVNALEKALRERKLTIEVYDLLAAQGAQLEALGDTSRASELWGRAARYADTELNDEERALTAYQKVAGLRVDDDAYDALARIRLARDEPGLAVPWLERRLQRYPADGRVGVRLLLAQAEQRAGHAEAAVSCLAEGIAEAPDAFELRDALVAAYREAGRTEELAALLSDSALRAKDKAQLLAYARSAASLFCDTLKQPSRALEVLSRAVEAEPEDRALRCLYADGLTAAGRLDEAKGVLDALVLEFGRRRSPERAEVHVRLSRVAKAAGDLREALVQLDTASSMDRAHVGILYELGALAQEAGELDRAERAYRALLMIVRKAAADGNAQVGVAEVLYQLHHIASVQDQKEKAAELLESAVQAAVQSEAETARLKALLLERGEPALLIRVFELRLSQVNEPRLEAEVLSDLADVFERGLGKVDEALDVRLRALGCAPESELLHEATLRVATAANKPEKYVDALRTLIERVRRKDDAGLVGDLALRAGTILEHVIADLPAAREQYALVDASVPAYVEALTGLARVAHKLRDTKEEREVLGRIASLPDSEETAPYKHAARYRAVELDARAEETREAGLLALMALLSETPDYPRAAEILKAVCDADPKDPRALSMFEQIARKSADARFLLDFLERHAATPEPALGLIREGAELALSLSERGRAEALLKRAIEVAKAGDGLADAAWAPLLLARLYRDKGETRAALDWFEQALALSDPFESFERGLELAELAAKDGNDPARAIRSYEALREREPSDRRVWPALVELYRTQGALDKVLELVRATLDAMIDPTERNALRVETANMMFAAKLENEGAQLLEDVLAEDPDHQGATLTLADLYERRGENEALAELLRRKLEGAVQRHSPSIVPLSLRMGGLLSPTRPEQAAEIYREALNIVPDSDELLRVTITLLDPEQEGAERADLVERYLGGSGRNDEDALALALWLIDQRIASQDEGAVERALALGARVAPGHDQVSARLERWYRLREDYAHLAQYLEARAQEESDITRAVALFTEAAQLRIERLGQASEAAQLLRRARERAPADFELLKQAVHASAAAGELGQAMAEVDAALEEAKRPDSQRVELLLLRAEIAGLAGMHDDAVASLDGALALDAERVGTRLIAGLELAREAARERANGLRERELMLRVCALLAAQGDEARPIELLQDWSERHPDDIEALRMLLDLLFSAKRHADAVRVAEALMRSAGAELLPATAERLFAAAQGLGNLALARRGIELAATRVANDAKLVQLLSSLYEQTGDKRALAAHLGKHLSKSGPADKRAEELRRIGQLLLDAGDVESALGPLASALELKPDDVPTVLFIADVHISARRFQEAQDLLEHTMNAQRQRRSPELALLRYRMARLSDSAGDQEARLEWLNAALDADMSNGEVASETAVVAQNMGHFELALKALRAITMLRGECQMSRAEAFYRQAQIVAHKGEPRRAVLWAKKAKAEDANLPGIDQLLAELGEV